MTSNQTFFFPFLVATIFAGFMFIGCKDKAPEKKHSEAITLNQANEESKAVRLKEEKAEKIEKERIERRKELEARAEREEQEEIAEKNALAQKEKKRLAEKKRKNAARKKKEQVQGEKRKQTEEKAKFQKEIKTQSDVSVSNATKVIATKDPVSPVKVGTPEIVFARNFFNFEKIASGDVIDAIFKFTNIGDGPLVIENATATCGCTVPIYSFVPIEPGQSSEIKVRFDTKGKEGKQQPIITVFTNSEPSVYKLYIDGEVGPADPTEASKDSLSTKN